MAKKLTVALVDDLDQSDAVETIQFMLDGVEYEIDLSEANAWILRNHLEPFVRTGRNLSRRHGVRPSSTNRRTLLDQGMTSKIRQWATEEGFDVQPIGRLSYEVIQAYQFAHRR